MLVQKFQCGSVCNAEPTKLSNLFENFSVKPLLVRFSKLEHLNTRRPKIKNLDQ